MPRQPSLDAASPSTPSAKSLLRGVCLVLAAFIGSSLFLTLGEESIARGETDRQEDFPEIFEIIDERLEESYFDLDRIQPRNLIERALSSLELSADEIYVEPLDGKQPYVAMHVGDKVKVLSLHNLRTRKDSVELLEAIFEFLARNYDGESSLNELRYAAANGYLSGIDPHTLVFTPENFEEFETHIKGEIVGVGMMVGSTESGKLEVKQVLKDTPAARAGFLKGDQIAKIDDESTINMTVMEAVQKIRGPKGSEVILTIKRPAKDKDTLETKEIAVRRDRVVIKSVESKLIREWDAEGKSAWKGGVGYVKVTQFDQNTVDSLESNLERLANENKGELAGLVLDLRGNSGGLLNQAVAMSDLFLERGDIVVTAKKDDQLLRTQAKDDGNEPKYPIILLADDQSASGSEIVLGALQKNNRGIVLGMKSFGKGSVQQLQGLPHGAQLKITVSEYLLPGDVSIQENGVVPNILAEEVVLEDDYVDLFPIDRRIGELDYEARLISKYKRDEKPAYRIKYLLRSPKGDDDGAPTLSERFISGDLEPEKDPLVQMALHVLRMASRPFRPQQILDQSKELFGSLEESFFGENITRLKELGIDWSVPPADAAPPAPGSLELELEHQMIEEPSKDAEDRVPVNKLLVRAKLTNRGTTPFYRLKGISRSDYYPYEDHELLFGRVDPGQTVERSDKIVLPYFPRAQNNEFILDVTSDGEGVLVSKSTTIELQARELPSFAFVAKLLDGSGNVIEKLKPGSGYKMELRIRNSGAGPAYKGVAILRNKTGREVFLEKGRLEFSDLAPGKEEAVEFAFDIREGSEIPAYKMELVIYDSYSNESLTRLIQIPREGEQGAGFPNGKLFEMPKIRMNLTLPKSGPAAGPLLVTDARQAILEASVTSAAESFKTWVTVAPITERHKNLDKVYYATSTGDSTLALKTPIELSEGLNLVTLVAKDASGMEQRSTISVRKTPTSSASR